MNQIVGRPLPHQGRVYTKVKIPRAIVCGMNGSLVQPTIVAGMDTRDDRPGHDHSMAQWK